MTGIDGTNPLGFIASLGVVAAIGGRLCWEQRENGVRWTPIIEVPPALGDREVLVAALWAKLEPMPYAYTFADTGEPAYDDFREKKATNGEQRKSKEVRAVTEEVFRRALERCADQPAELERLAAHTCAIALRSEPVGVTAVRSASGQVRYLRTLRDIVTSASAADIERALFGVWQYRRAPKLGLDPSGRVDNVNTDVSALGAVSEIGAERLALEGLRALPTSVQGRRLVTRGYASDGLRFRWPLWMAEGRSSRAVSSLLGSRSLFADDELRGWMDAYTIATVFESQVLRYGQGYRTLRPAVRIV